MANIIKLPQYIWYEPREVEFPLPDSWEVAVHNIAGYDLPVMTPEQVRTSITSPIGMPPLREMAKGKKEVVIIFDDMTRSTPIHQMLPPILDELAEAGIADSQIRFIAAIANHQALDRISMVKKLGEEVLARIRVYNHCPFMNCTYIGTTSFGTKVSINSEVMHCDLKIGIGEVSPHISHGFSGGAKIVMPGVAAYETVTQEHSQTHKEWRAKIKEMGVSCMGIYDDNPMNADIREIGQMAGLDMIVDCIVNVWGEPVEIFAGALEPAYEKVVEKAKSHYLVANTCDNDIVIANAYIKASEFQTAWVNAYPAVKPEGGDVVVIANSPNGQVVHYLLGTFGKTIRGSIHRQHLLPPNVNHLIIYTEYPELRILDVFPEKDKVLLMSDWNEVVKTLEGFHGATAKVAVFPCADIQYSTD